MKKDWEAVMKRAKEGTLREQCLEFEMKLGESFEDFIERAMRDAPKYDGPYCDLFESYWAHDLLSAAHVLWVKLQETTEPPEAR